MINNVKTPLFRQILSNFFNVFLLTTFSTKGRPYLLDNKKAGMAARAVYLKKKYNFPYLHFLATLSAIYIIIFFVGGLGVLLSMLVIWAYYGMFNITIFLLFLFMTTILFLIIIFSPKLPEAQNKWINRIIKVINGWHLIKNNKKIIFSTAIISLVQLTIGTINTMITYSIFGIHMGFFKALFITSIGYVSIIVAITPGNLGVGDAINVFSATIIGIGLKEAVAATVLGRAISLVVIFILGPIFSYILLKDIKKGHIDINSQSNLDKFDNILGNDRNEVDKNDKH